MSPTFRIGDRDYPAHITEDEILVFDEVDTTPLLACRRTKRGWMSETRKNHGGQYVLSPMFHPPQPTVDKAIKLASKDLNRRK